MAKKLDPKPLFILGILAVLVVGGWFILGGGEGNQNYYDFAACLAENDVTMYGFDLCPNCNKQKSLIGREAFSQYIDDTGRYVRCRAPPEGVAQEPVGDARLQNITILPEYSDQVSGDMNKGDLCALMVGRGTPTWIYTSADTGEVEQFSGWLSVPQLAERTGCPVPEGATGQNPESEGSRFTEQ